MIAASISEEHLQNLSPNRNLPGGEFPMLKKALTSAIMTSVLALTVPFAATTTVNAQTRYCTCRTSRHRTVRRSVARRTYNANGYTSTRYATTYKKPNVYQRHRRLFNTMFGAGAGALVGGLLGGRRGAGIGLLAGGAGSQILTHYQRPTNYYRVRRP